VNRFIVTSGLAIRERFVERGFMGKACHPLGAGPA